MSFNWHVACITTKRKSPTLERTLDSLADAGWPHVMVLSDRQGVGCWQTWQWAAKCLMRCLSQINEDRVLIVEDDGLHARGLRDYLDSNPDEIFTNPSVVSPYTSSFNHKPEDGWAEVPLIEGRPIRTYGAISLILPVYLMPALLDEPPNKDQPNGTDHNIGLFCRRENIPFFCHSPSFVSHIGAVSTLPKAGVKEYRHEESFCSDASELFAVTK